MRLYRSHVDISVNRVKQKRAFEHSHSDHSAHAQSIIRAFTLYSLVSNDSVN